MNQEPLLVNRPSEPASAADAQEIARALAGSTSGTSDANLRYEAALADWFEAGFAVSTSSGTTALLAASASLGLRSGDEVILAPTAPLCTVYALLWLRLVPVFCDVRRDSFALDPDEVRRALTPRTRALLEVPMWGYPVPADELREVARSVDLPLMLDLAHGHGVRLHGRHLSAYSDVATFSTHGSKIFPTGEGGFLLTDDPEIASAARGYCQFGGLDGVHFGLNFKLSGLQAALGLARLQTFSDHLAARERNARTLLERLDHPLLAPFPVARGGEPNYFTLLLQERSGSTDRLAAHLASHGIASEIRKYRCRPLYEYPLLKGHARPCPNSAALLRSTLDVPLDPGFGPEALDRISHALSTYPRDP